MPVYLGFRSKKLKTLAIRRDTHFLRNAKIALSFFSDEVVSHFVALSFCHWVFWSSISYLARVSFSKK